MCFEQAEDQAYIVNQDEGTVKLDQAYVEGAKLALAYTDIISETVREPLDSHGFRCSAPDIHEPPIHGGLRRHELIYHVDALPTK